MKGRLVREVTGMMEVQPLFVSTDTVPAWLAVAFFAFWAGLPGILRWLLNINNIER
jgi:hypothetical protein